MASLAKGKGIAKSTVIVTILGCLCLTASGDWLGREVDNTRYAYGCLDDGIVELSCDKNEILGIIEVAYGGEPLGCADTFTDKNDCQQVSQTLTDGAKTQCDGNRACNMPIVKIGSELLDIDDIIPVQDNCAVGVEFHSSVIVNYMVVKYTCQGFYERAIDFTSEKLPQKQKRAVDDDTKGFTFCTDIAEIEVKDLIIATKGFPEVVVSNPTCDCTFQSGGETSYVQIIAMCNGTVTFVLEETMENPEQSSEYIVSTKRYFCKDHLPPKGLFLGSDSTISMGVSIDADNSSEYSSFSLTVLVLYKTYTGGFQQLKRRADSTSLVSCTKGALWLPKRVTLILSIAVPVGTVLLITLIVVYCCVKKRRKKARQWRKRHVSLRSSTYTGPRAEHNSNAGHTSPQASHCSTPSSTRRKPDGKLDSDSDEDLALIAAKLHRQNTERQAAERKKREAYYNTNNGNSSSLPGHAQRMPMHQSYSHQYGSTFHFLQSFFYQRQIYQLIEDLDLYQSPGSDPRGCTPGDRRCKSIGNLRRSEADDANIEELRTSLHNRPRSSSHSRSHSRSGRPPQPLNPPLLYETQIHNHRNQPPAIYQDDDDPDLAFNDPRQGDCSRECTPVRDLTPVTDLPSQQEPRPHLYNRQRSRSIGNLRPPNRTDHKRSALQGTRSVSNSRTSLRSMKRRAPQPPAFTPAFQPYPTASNTPTRNGPGTPVRSRANTPTRRDQSRRPTQLTPNNSFNYTHNSKKNDASSVKPKCFNPYAVRYPPRNINRPINRQYRDDSTDSPSKPLVMGGELPTHERRRYSDTGSLDESEHGGEDVDVGIMGNMGGDTMDGMLDDDQW